MRTVASLTVAKQVATFYVELALHLELHLKDNTHEGELNDDHNTTITVHAINTKHTMRTISVTKKTQVPSINLFNWMRSISTMIRTIIAQQ